MQMMFKEKYSHMTSHLAYNLKGKMHFVIFFFGVFKCNSNVKWALIKLFEIAGGGCLTFWLLTRRSDVASGFYHPTLPFWMRWDLKLFP